MERKNKHFRHILLFYFRKGKKAAEAHKEICEVYGVNYLTPTYMSEFVLKISFWKFLTER